MTVRAVRLVVSLKPIAAGVAAAAGVGEGFRLTQTEIAIITLMTGLVTAAVVNLIQVRGRRGSDESDRSLKDYAIARLSELEHEVETLLAQVASKDEIIRILQAAKSDIATKEVGP